MSGGPKEEAHGLAGRLALVFIDSNLTPILVVFSVLLGGFAVFMLPREEEPQIKVPMIDVFVEMPGASAKEVEERVTHPMEKLLWEIPGVEFIYSTSTPGQSLVVVRFEVGRNAEESLVSLNHQLRANFDRIPPGVGFPLIKAKSIDDVPIPALTLHSDRYDRVTLRRIAAEVEDAIKEVPDVAETLLIGGERRMIHVYVDPAKLASRNLSLAGIVPVLQQANRQVRSGEITTRNQAILIESGGFLRSPKEVGIAITRHYGKTAAEKSNELLLHMGIAVAGVSLLILLTLGRRESLIVALAIPSTLALTLVVFFLYGYTLNRITLFALIFCIGILVDDAIVVVENIVRHFRLPESRALSPATIAVRAVSEEWNPTVLATWAVIAAIMPMAFVGGLMGPYMRPIPIGASAAMVFSLLISFIVTPWASIPAFAPPGIRLRARERCGGRTRAGGRADPALSPFHARGARAPGAQLDVSRRHHPAPALQPGTRAPWVCEGEDAALRQQK